VGGAWRAVCHSAHGLFARFQPDFDFSSATHAPDRFRLLFCEWSLCDYDDEVANYTDLYRGGKYDYPYSTDPESMKWLPEMERHFPFGLAERRKISLALEWGVDDAQIEKAEAESILKMMKPFWNRVMMIELADEPSWDRAETSSACANCAKCLKAEGLRVPPVGVTYTRRQLMHEDAIFSAGLDSSALNAISIRRAVTTPRPT